MNFFIEEWFPVQVLVADASHLLEPAKLMFDLTDFSKYEDERYPNGVTTFFAGGGFPSEENYDWFPFVGELLNVVSVLSEKQGIEIKRGLKMTDIWLNRMSSKSGHPRHAHPNNHYSGTLYVSVPPNSGNIRFYSPAENHWGLTPVRVDKGAIPTSSTYVDYSPAPGKLLIWNSWLFHEVLPSEFEGYRESISFNFWINQK